MPEKTSFDAAGAYVDLLKRSLLDLVNPETYDARPEPDGRTVEIVRAGDRGRALRIEGTGWPANATTMVGMKRLDSLQRCVEDVLAAGVPGDLIETGVWRGGASILMRALLRLHGAGDRTVWVADSFRGLPEPDTERYPQDTGDRLHMREFLSVPLQDVKANFERYGLLDDRVRFLEGWFRDTLPTVRDRRWAIVRLDGDLYESTMDGLENLYAGLSPGGYLIVDDYGSLRKCKQAVDDFREANGITEPVETIDWTGAFWRKRP